MIREATPADRDAIWGILGPVIRAGDTYALDHDMKRDEALAYWMGSDRHCFVVEDDATILGTYYLRRNQAGRGAHVCNCGYMVSPKARGRGLARQMCEHSQEEARSRGYRAMQFNFVVATNNAAVGLWESMGFATVGTLPRAFDHPAKGLVDALIMYKDL